ncbi:MAG: GNAT family N-acetyltransferase [Clostridiales bacterium]|nr:GNAT family N-acetyltransferase [Clostridiales bacterium]
MNLMGYDLILRDIEINDYKILKEMINDPEIESCVLGWSFPVNDEKQKNWIINRLDNNTLRLMIESKSYGVVGTIGLKDIDFKNSVCSIYIKLASSAPKRKGIGYNAMKLLINYVFEELNLNLITAQVLEYNLPSLNLFNKLGFIEEATLRDRIYKKGKYHNIKVLSLKRKEFYCDK